MLYVDRMAAAPPNHRPTGYSCDVVWLVQSRFAETPTLTLTLNPNFGESGRHRLASHNKVHDMAYLSRYLFTSANPTHAVLSDVTFKTHYFHFAYPLPLAAP